MDYMSTIHEYVDFELKRILKKDIVCSRKRELEQIMKKIQECEDELGLYWYADDQKIKKKIALESAIGELKGPFHKRKRGKLISKLKDLEEQIDKEWNEKINSVYAQYGLVDKSTCLDIEASISQEIEKLNDSMRLTQEYFDQHDNFAKVKGYLNSLPDPDYLQFVPILNDLLDAYKQKVMTLSGISEETRDDLLLEVFKIRKSLGFDQREQRISRRR